ncbi:oxidoreductase [Croceicoccus estronivorus]|uniref:SDR family oxidoreductase n=1 Tax=Croceicoccus estronivorus TaxID=1172626 RepID=UPI000830EF5C|nr:SDR family NAD(P)-dependent oxidoreductase [Croceicoccus estronivorus]OCC25149.1 oxidoreductase [Croceicoccus estronivorus]
MTVAVITGAAGGIGAGLAREAARRGMQVVLADRDEDALREVARGIGNAAYAVPTDVTDADACEALAEKAYNAHGQVDLLFNNAGVLATGNSWEIPPEKWRQSWAVNVDGVLNGLRAFVPRLIAAERPARIINTASVGGFLPSPLMAPYSATKFAVVALTESLAGELQALGTSIAVSLLAPGPVKSGIFREEPPEQATQFHTVMTNMLEEHGLTGDEFAPLVLDAVERGEYWIFPQPEVLEPAFSARNQQILERKAPQFFLVDQDV